MGTASRHMRLTWLACSMRSWLSLLTKTAGLALWDICSPRLLSTESAYRSAKREPLPPSAWAAARALYGNFDALPPDPNMALSSPPLPKASANLLPWSSSSSVIFAMISSGESCSSCLAEGGCSTASNAASISTKSFFSPRLSSGGAGSCTANVSRHRWVLQFGHLSMPLPRPVGNLWFSVATGDGAKASDSTALVMAKVPGEGHGRVPVSSVSSAKLPVSSGFASLRTSVPSGGTPPVVMANGGNARIVDARPGFFWYSAPKCAAGSVCATPPSELGCMSLGTRGDVSDSGLRLDLYCCLKSSNFLFSLLNSSVFDSHSRLNFTCRTCASRHFHIAAVTFEASSSRSTLRFSYPALKVSTFRSKPCTF
mmetsp:Transcript_23694/g.65888  ORF Transcript_23694/g.65888 Transcript_23694/m.65888 type:complete len:369 (+) Transcript_23694:160-1266(+)